MKTVGFSSMADIAVITGGSSGIGEAIAQTLVKADMTIINADKNPPSDYSIPYIPCDITNPAQIDRLYHRVIHEYGIPDLLISNAGVNIHEKIAEGDPEKWNSLFAVNVLGALRFIRAFLPAMLDKGKGHIIFISSVASYACYPYGGIYSASKAAINALAETLRLEVQPAIKVSVVCPGSVDTPFFKNTLNGPRDVTEIPWKPLSPQDIARHVKSIISSEDHVATDFTILRPKGQHL
jgi:NADP-dependent 3-hydroxy acid dehydrogenase YdfG